jgi:exodeoxyribonuclease VII large subunit
VLVRINQVVIQRSTEIIHQRKNELLSASAHVTHKPRLQVAKRRHELEMQVNNLHTFRIQYLKNKALHLQHLELMIRMASPEQTLKRGFAIVKHEGKVISDASALKVDDQLVIEMRDSDITTQITAIKENDERAYHI